MQDEVEELHDQTMLTRCAARVRLICTAGSCDARVQSLTARETESAHGPGGAGQHVHDHGECNWPIETAHTSLMQ